ncbi:MAG TPA: sulfotransferase domain-containing protein [Gammaproteobacteria bacterium]
MTVADGEYPQRTRELHNALMDSDRWDSFRFRDGDIVIDTWAKSGTTWTQQIVGQLVFNGEEHLPVMKLAPWVDMRFVPVEEVIEQVEAQTHRRFLKSHLPADALLFSPKAKYVFLARDGRDVAWSWYNHLRRMSQEFFDLFNDTPNRVGPTLDRPGEDVRQFFHEWLDQDGFFDWSYFDHIQSWWNIRNAPNVTLFHYNNLKANLPGGMRRMAEFLEIEVDEAKWPELVEHCTFDYMKANADDLMPDFPDAWEGGWQSFVYKGTNRRWADVLTPEDLAKYECVVQSKLSPGCAHWHATGEMPD